MRLNAVYYVRMTFLQKLIVLTAIAVMIAVGALARGRAEAAAPARATATWLAVITIALIIVGIVSHTLLRHAVQVAPLVVAIVLSFRASRVAVAAAAPLFAFWLLVMAAIWLFLLGIARIFSGTFTPVEITLTIIIGIASVLGLLSTFVRGAEALTVGRIGTVLGFAMLQFAAMWVSVQPFVARR
jgi:hypothetical protein